jgi:replicative DNA helicase
VGSEKIRKGEVRDTEFRRFVEASQTLASIPLYIDDTPALSIAQVRTRSRRLKRQYGLGLIVIDYLQLLRGTGSVESRVLEISEITRGLKALAKELSVPVMALSQLSRAVEQRDDKRPQLSDLRESGTIEQDSDVVMFVFREEYYIERGNARAYDLAGRDGKGAQHRRSHHRQAASWPGRHRQTAFRRSIHPLQRPRQPIRRPLTAPIKCRQRRFGRHPAVV